VIDVGRAARVIDARALDAGDFLQPPFNGDLTMDAGHSAHGKFLRRQRI
jgi:hypothetical protein